MRRTACFGIFLLLILTIAAGCKTTTVGAKSDDDVAADAASSASKERDEALAAMTAEQAEKLAAIEAKIAAIANAAASREFEPDFMNDIGVATGLVSQLSKDAREKQAKNALETVRRLRGAISILVATCPAQRIQQHLERAEFNLNTGDLPAAGDQVLAAAGAAYNPSAAAIVPDVLSTLEDASMAIDAADVLKASGLIAKARLKTTEDTSVSKLLAAELTVLEAEESIRRQAWPILMAQTKEIINLVGSVQTAATPTIKPEPEEAEEDPAPEPKPEPKPEPAPEPAVETETAEPAPADTSETPAPDAADETEETPE